MEEMFRRTSLAPIGEMPARRILFIDNNEEAETQRPACSPDEFVIRQRGRRSLPVTWSPDDNLRKQNYYNSSKKAAKPPAVKTGSMLRSAAFKRRLLGPEDCYTKKSKTKKTDSVNMMTTRTHHKKISFTPEKLAFIDMSTPLKFKLLTLEKPQVKKPVLKLNLDVVDSPESHGRCSRKRAHDNDGESSLSAVKKSKS